MLLFLSKWIAASLIVPLLVLAFQKMASSIQLGVVLFWPGSIMLMSLGGPSPRDNMDVIYVWGMAVGSNVLLYLILGCIVYYFKSKVAS